MKNCFLIINYNDYDTTATLLNNIKDYKVIDEIVVVDNCSSDDSYDKLMTNHDVTVIKNSSNKGYASGINVGSRYLYDKYNECNIIVSNADIIIYNEKDIINLVSNIPDNYGIIAPIIKEHDGYNRGWKIPSPFQDGLLNIIYIHRKLRPKLLYYPDEYYQKEIVEVEAVSGCFFVINSKCLNDVDYFDENTFLYYEENIISKKLQKINKKIYINTSIEVFHNHSVSIDKSINHLNKYKVLKKSQYYFQREYNNANKCSLFFIKLNEKITYGILYLKNK